MQKRLLSFLMVLLISIACLGTSIAAASDGVDNMSNAKLTIDQALDNAETDIVASKQAYDQFHDLWFDIEDTVKTDSKSAYRDIETQMGRIEYAFITNNREDVKTALQNLQQIADKYIQGQY